MTFLRLVFLFALGLSFSGCELTGKDTGANSGLDQANTLDQEGLLQPDGTLVGSGLFVVPESLGQVKGLRSFRLRFALEDGGSLKLISYANQEMGAGVELEFVRHRDVIELSFAASGAFLNTTDRLLDYDAGGVLDFVIDVHNNHDDAAHVFVWPFISDSPQSYGPENALINSDFFALPTALDGFDFPDWYDLSAKGNGNFWGLELKDARVLRYYSARAMDES